ncbi:hypothetical protein AAHC03_01705 [Spirometra sp. Aus1]
MSEISDVLTKTEPEAPKTCCQNVVTIEWIKMPGTIYIRLLQLTILPVISANIICVMAGMDPKENGKVGVAAMGFIVGMDIISGAIGVIAAVLIKPGVLSSIDNTTETQKNETSLEAPVTTSDVFADLFLNIFPDNVIGIAIFQTQTTREFTNAARNETKRIVGNLFATDMIGLIFTSIVFGIAAGKAGANGRVFVDFFQSVSDVVLTIMRWFLQATPVGVCFMVAGAVVGLQDVAGTFKKLLLFMATVLAALAVHMIIQMIVYTIASFRNPFLLLIKAFKVWFLAFITTAPLICIPDMIETCDRYGLQKKITRFVIPFSAALKGDGSGAFQAVACVFIAQLTGFDLSVGTYVIIALLTGFATLAIPNVPSSSIVIVITILSSLGVRTEEVSLLFAVEWIMDRCRSGSIGLGHIFAAAFTHSVAVGRRTEHQEDEGDNVGEDKEASVEGSLKDDASDKVDDY